MTEGVKFVEADAHGHVPHGWAEAQVLASADFAHGSWLWTHFSGGLNYQARTFTSRLSPQSTFLWPFLRGLRPHEPIKAAGLVRRASLVL